MPIRTITDGVHPAGVVNGDIGRVELEVDEGRRIKVAYGREVLKVGGHHHIKMLASFCLMKDSSGLMDEGVKGTISCESGERPGSCQQS